MGQLMLFFLLLQLSKTTIIGNLTRSDESIKWLWKTGINCIQFFSNF